MKMNKNLSPDSKNNVRNIESGLRKAFTLVELIVVITILAILGTIAFISLQGYSRDARDSTRTADLGNIKKSLELYSLKTGNYPKPDSSSIISYSGDTVWYQGVVGDNVTTNLKSLNEKPLDPLTGDPYVYSATQSYGEYEVLALYEGSVAYNQSHNPNYLPKGEGISSIFPQANAATTSLIPKIDGTYNGVYVTTASYIIPTPSIITAEALLIGTPLPLTPINIRSQVITNGTNIPKSSLTTTETGGLIGFNLAVFTGSITKSSPDAKKIEAITQIQQAYSGSTTLKTQGNISYILNQTSTGQQLELTKITLLKGHSSSNTNVVVNNTPTPSDTIPPVLNSITQTFTTTVGTALTLVTVTANDAVDGVVTVIQGGVTPNFNTIGIYAVTYSATDVAGNNSIITHTYQVDAVVSYPGCDTPDITIGAYTISACNVGTNIAGTIYSSYGGLFQFGRNIAYPTWTNGTVGNQYDWKGPLLATNGGSANDWGVQEANKTTATYANVSAADKVKMQGPCATGYHVPTNAEWVGIHAAGGWFTNGTNMSNALKMPNTGNRNWSSASLYNQSINGLYWSSSPNGTNGYNMAFYSSNIFPSDNNFRAYGFSVRCFKN